MKKYFFLIIAIVIPIYLMAEVPIVIYESTIKIKGFGEEYHMFGLAEGDQLVVTVQEQNGKELKEIELIEFPSSSRFVEAKTSGVYSKTITISKTSIFKLRIENSAMSGRICNVKIERIPYNEESKRFNSTVYYKTLTDTIITNLTDQVAKVHSLTNENGNVSAIQFNLPRGTTSWGYYIGVDQSGQEAYQKAARELSKSASPKLLSLIGINPIVSVILGSSSYMAQLQSGEDIEYWIVDEDNKNLLYSNKQFMCFKKGKVINDLSTMTSPTVGAYYLVMKNDNVLAGVQVTVKITAVSITSREVPYLQN